MLEFIYIVLLCFTVILFFIGVGNVLKLEKESRSLFMFITAILFMVLTYASFTVESKYCVYTTEFLCETFASQEYVMAILCFMFLLITILYLIMDWLGKIPEQKPTVNQERV